MNKLLKIWHRSLLLKLNAPLAILAFVLAIFVYLMMLFEEQTLSHRNAEQVATLVLDTIKISAEMDSSEAGLARTVRILGVNRNLHNLLLIDDETDRIIAASRPEMVGQKSDLGSINPRLLATNSLLAHKEFTMEKRGDGFDVVSRILLADHHRYQMRDILVVMRLDMHPESNSALHALWFSEWVMLIAVFAMILAFGLVQRDVLTKRLSEFKQLIQAEMSAVGFAINREGVGDELDRIKYMFIDLLWGKKQAEVETEHALQMAENSSRARSAFLANMSHELRTPLNSIIGFSRRILKTQEGLDERQASSLNIVLNNGIHLLGLINDILDLSKIDAGRLELNVTEQDIASLTRSFMQEFVVQANDKGLYLHMDLVDGIRAEVDELRYRQIVANLVSNAIKYTEKGGIRISLTQEGGKMQLAITDTGLGIREEDQKRLFRRFEQFDENSRFQVGHGTGLGLSIVNEFVRLHGGSVRVTSEFGKGSCFEVYLPALDRE